MVGGEQAGLQPEGWRLPVHCPAGMMLCSLLNTPHSRSRKLSFAKCSVSVILIRKEMIVIPGVECDPGYCSCWVDHVNTKCESIN